MFSLVCNVCAVRRVFFFFLVLFLFLFFFPDLLGNIWVAQSEQGLRCPLTDSLDTLNVCMENRGSGYTLRMLSMI